MKLVEEVRKDIVQLHVYAWSFPMRTRLTTLCDDVEQREKECATWEATLKVRDMQVEQLEGERDGLNVEMDVIGANATSLRQRVDVLTPERDQLRKANAKLTAVCQQLTLDPGEEGVGPSVCINDEEKLCEALGAYLTLLWEQTEGAAIKPVDPVDTGGETNGR